jgi:endonuclease/exonuclease/phosphatase family metal-dependent hydrolase
VEISAPLPVEEISTPAENEPAGPIRFIAYNVQNWLTMDRYVGGKLAGGSPKPSRDKAAVIEILAHNQPDVIGLCEVGTVADLEEIREGLKTAGLDLPHTYYTGGVDPTRHLGLLSRFPIAATARPAETEYRLSGRSYGINRGILDATVHAHGKSWRFVGIHLKSKRDSEAGDQEAMRLNEGRLLRRHVDAILRRDPSTRLIVYGDFNDTRASPTLKTVIGKNQDPAYLAAIPVKDSRGEAWTHYWELQDVYSRFDFILLSHAIRSDLDSHSSHIIDDAGWNDASDHRPVLAVFR